jgi:Ca2+:H+ antiporter
VDTLDAMRREWPLLLNLPTTVLFLALSTAWFSDLSSLLWFTFLLLWLIVVILASAFAVMRHAEALAKQLGEPFGTPALTLAVTDIEVTIITAAMFKREGSPIASTEFIVEEQDARWFGSEISRRLGCGRTDR